MCGRYSMIATEKQIQQEIPFLENTGVNLRESFNIAPTQHAYVITNERPERLQYLTWGLIPFWSNDGANKGKLINARAEGISVKPSFRIPIRKRRCLIVADSFYEWRKRGTRKIPYRILPKDGSLLVMAGIWDEWQGSGHQKHSFSIITTTPNEEMSGLHTRMPVVFSDKLQYEQWLDDISLEDTVSMLHPVRDDYFKIYRVSEMVNSVRNNSPHLHQEVPEDLDLFSQR